MFPRAGKTTKRQEEEKAMRCRMREQITDSGAYREVKIYPVYGEATSGKRRKRYRPTSEAQQRLNDWNSQRHLAQLIEENFSSNDTWIHPTFRDDALPENDDAFKRIFRNFIRRLKRAYKASGAELKYIAVLERSDTGRYHIHMIVNQVLTPAALRDLWNMGRVGVDPLEFGEHGLQGLAEYMTKYRLITRRYLFSRNLRQPQRMERDGRFSQRDARALARNPEDRMQWERLYPGYTFINCRPFYNALTGGQYICVRMWKPGRRRQ